MENRNTGTAEAPREARSIIAVIEREKIRTLQKNGALLLQFDGSRFSLLSAPRRFSIFLYAQRE
jgi:hypothetical protein